MPGAGMALATGGAGNAGSPNAGNSLDTVEKIARVGCGKSRHGGKVAKRKGRARAASAGQVRASAVRREWRGPPLAVRTRPRTNRLASCEPLTSNFPAARPLAGCVQVTDAVGQGKEGSVSHRQQSTGVSEQKKTLSYAGSMFCLHPIRSVATLSTPDKTDCCSKRAFQQITSFSRNFPTHVKGPPNACFWTFLKHMISGSDGVFPGLEFRSHLWAD
jgi:hypothetical protein